MYLLVFMNLIRVALQLAGEGTLRNPKMATWTTINQKKMTYMNYIIFFIFRFY